MSYPSAYHISRLDRLMHEPARLMIVALLASVAQADFTAIVHLTGLSRGNVSIQLTKLEAAGYIRIEKIFRGKMPCTMCALTEQGQNAYQQYCTTVQELFATANASSAP